MTTSDESQVTGSQRFGSADLSQPWKELGPDYEVARSREDSLDRLELAEQLVETSSAAVRSYLAHFWRHWSGPDFVIDDDHFSRLVEVYSAPGAFRASIAWYRAGGGTVAQSEHERDPDPEERVAVPLTVLWPECDVLFPRDWSNRVSGFFSRARIVPVDAVGHFVPLECPDVMANEILTALR